MRTALILARKPGELYPTVISGPEIPIRQQMDRYKGLLVTAVSHEYLEVQFWTSDGGMTRRKKFRHREAGVDLSVKLAALDLADLCEFADNHDIDLAGLGERQEIIATIVIALKTEHLRVQDDGGSDDDTPPVPLEATDGDPGVFGGPSLALIPGNPSS